MSYPSAAHNAYASAAQFITPIRAVVLLYERAIQEMLAARTAIQNGQIEERFQRTQKAAQIITALQGNLDFERGGDISPMLRDFYNSLFDKIQRVNFRNDLAICDDVILALNTMRQTWEEVARRMDAQPAAATPAAQPAPDMPRPTGTVISA